MKSIYTFLIAFCLMGNFAQAQGRIGQRGPQAKERIKAAKKQFLIQELALSDEQAGRFWPVYDAFDKEMEENHEKIKTLKQGFNAKSDAQLKEDLGKFFKYREEEIAIEKKYFQKFQNVLTIRQIAALYQSEQKFKRYLIEQIRQRGGRGGMMPPPEDRR